MTKRYDFRSWRTEVLKIERFYKWNRNNVFSSVSSSRNLKEIQFKTCYNIHWSTVIFFRCILSELKYKKRIVFPLGLNEHQNTFRELFHQKYKLKNVNTVSAVERYRNTPGHVNITSNDWGSLSWFSRVLCVLLTVAGLFWGGSTETPEEPGWLLCVDESCSFSQSLPFPDSAGAAISGDASGGPGEALLVTDTVSGATL